MALGFLGVGEGPGEGSVLRLLQLWAERCGLRPGMGTVGQADGLGFLRIDDINRSCLEQFRAHWECLDNNNQQMWHCRPQEWKLNGCVFDKLV